MKVDLSAGRRKSRVMKFRSDKNSNERNKKAKKNVEGIPEESVSVENVIDADDERDDVLEPVETSVHSEHKTDFEESEGHISGFVCNSCSQIGIYARNEELKKVITESSNKRRSKEKCLICKTYQNRNFNEGNANISSNITYSYEFYDKFSRDKKYPYATIHSNDQSTKKDEKEVDETTEDDSKSENSNESENSEQNLSGEDNDNEEGTESRLSKDFSEAFDKITSIKESKKNRKSPPKVKRFTSIPRLPSIHTRMSRVISDDRSSTDRGTSASSKDDSVVDEKIKLPPLSKVSLKEDNSTSKNKPQTRTKRYSELFNSIYQKRAMKGSTVRKSDLSRTVKKEEINHVHYSVDYLGLTFGVPQFNFKLDGRPLHKPKQSTVIEPYGEKAHSQTLLPPIGKTIGSTFSLRTT